MPIVPYLRRRTRFEERGFRMLACVTGRTADSRTPTIGVQLGGSLAGKLSLELASTSSEPSPISASGGGVSEFSFRTSLMGDPLRQTLPHLAPRMREKCDVGSRPLLGSEARHEHARPRRSVDRAMFAIIPDDFDALLRTALLIATRIPLRCRRAQAMTARWLAFMLGSVLETCRHRSSYDKGNAHDGS